jgi:hypothetical protein
MKHAKAVAGARRCFQILARAELDHRDDLLLKVDSGRRGEGGCPIISDVKQTFVAARNDENNSLLKLPFPGSTEI